MPSWPCPNCKTGEFSPVKDSLIQHQTERSKAWLDLDSSDPEAFELLFSAWAKCSYKSFGQMATISGYTVESPLYGEDGLMWETVYRPLSIFPSPHIIEIPANCPQNVQEPVTASFSLFWADPGAAANKLRIALERLLDHVGIPEGSLHSRLVTYQQTNKHPGGLLMAIKWLGNTGSHEGSVSKGDLLDAYELIEVCLDEIISERSKKFQELADKLTEKHTKK